MNENKILCVKGGTHSPLKPLSTWTVCTIGSIKDRLFLVRLFYINLI